MNKLSQWFQNLTDVRRMAEINRLILRSSRRCTRDLGHALAFIPPEFRSKFEERYSTWIEIFWDCSQYRDELYTRIDDLESQNERLRKIVAKAGLEEVPF